MEKYLLDTVSWIEYFKNRSGVADRVDALPRQQLCASEVTVAELIYGVITAKTSKSIIVKPSGSGAMLKYSLSPKFSMIMEKSDLPRNTREIPLGNLTCLLAQQPVIMD